MDNETEVIRQQIEGTRAALTEKLETLEDHVVETMHEATTAVGETVETVKETVEETVGTVKETVEETVETVKETFDLRLQVQRHPWAMVGGSVAVGFALGRVLGRIEGESGPALSGRDRDQPAAGPAAWRGSELEQTMLQSRTPAPAPAPGQNLLGGVANKFGSELARLKGLAIGATLSMLRDVLTQSAPDPLRGRLKEVMDDVTVKLGGEPIHGPIWNLGDGGPRPVRTEEEWRPEPGPTSPGKVVGATHG
jgi:ElaB/YqjD/DUF883 family membrane-anchored ribosome-binding protein